MIESIYQLLIAAIFAAQFFMFAPRIHQHLLQNRNMMQHQELRLLATMTIGTVITELYNGEDVGDLTLDAQITNIEMRLADVLLANGYQPRAYSARHLTTAALAQANLLKPLREAIHDRKERQECQVSTSSTAPTPSEDSESGAL